MSDDNHNDAEKIDKPSMEPKEVIKILLHPNGSFEMKSIMQPPMVNWVFDQIKHNMLHQSMAPPSTIIKPSVRGGMMNFARRFKR